MVGFGSSIPVAGGAHLPFCSAPPTSYTRCGRSRSMGAACIQCFPPGHTYSMSSVQKALFLKSCHPTTEGAVADTFCDQCHIPLGHLWFQSWLWRTVAWEPRPSLCQQPPFYLNGTLLSLSALKWGSSWQPRRQPLTNEGGCPVDKCPYSFQFRCLKHLWENRVFLVDCWRKEGTSESVPGTKKHPGLWVFLIFGFSLGYCSLP